MVDMATRKRHYEYPAHRRYRSKYRLRFKRRPGEMYVSNHKHPLNYYAIRSMKEVAAILGITKSRVHQLERMALWKIRQKINI